MLKLDGKCSDSLYSVFSRETKESTAKARKPTNVVGNFPWVPKVIREFPLGTKGHSVVNWLLLKQLNARGGKASFLSPFVTACVMLVRTYSNYLSQTL